MGELSARCSRSETRPSAVYNGEIRMILVMNPKSSKVPLTLPSSFHHVTLATPYRSTINITSLARFIAQCKDLVVPEGDFGSDVKGDKPLVIDIGRVSEDRALGFQCIAMEKATLFCQEHLGDNATILYDNHIPGLIRRIVKEQGKEEGGPWDCYHAVEFYGWEAERVVVVTDGDNIMEMITRAKTYLRLIADICQNLQYFLVQKLFVKGEGV